MFVPLEEHKEEHPHSKDREGHYANETHYLYKDDSL